MEFLVTTTNVVSYQNKDLQKATNAIYKLGDAIKKNWFAIAYLVAEVEKTKCYEEDGFSTVHEWVEKTFGIKKTASYSLLAIGREYTRQITNASGKVIGYGTNLTENAEEDFSKTQVERMLPIGHDMAVELVTNGEITPEMTAKEIAEVVKSYKSIKSEEVNDDAEEVETENAPEIDVKENIVIVHDGDGNEYAIPVKVLKKYRL